MQLIVILLALMLAGEKVDSSEIAPVLSSLGGEGAAEAFSKAEELCGIISAVQSLAGVPEKKEPCDYPLAPIAGIADKQTLNMLSDYIALGE